MESLIQYVGPVVELDTQINQQPNWDAMTNDQVHVLLDAVERVSQEWPQPAMPPRQFKPFNADTVVIQNTVVIPMGSTSSSSQTVNIPIASQRQSTGDDEDDLRAAMSSLLAWAQTDHSFTDDGEDEPETPPLPLISKAPTQAKPKLSPQQKPNPPANPKEHLGAKPASQQLAAHMAGSSTKPVSPHALPQIGGTQANYANAPWRSQAPKTPPRNPPAPPGSAITMPYGVQQIARPKQPKAPAAAAPAHQMCVPKPPAVPVMAPQPPPHPPPAP